MVHQIGCIHSQQARGVCLVSGEAMRNHQLNELSDRVVSRRSWQVDSTVKKSYLFYKGEWAGPLELSA